jgi:hypothetical protein
MKIGITGHQRLNDSASWAWVEDSIDQELDAICPPLIAISSLAVGTDQLFAQIVRRRGGKVHAIIPFADYERTFSNNDLQLYRELLEVASIEILTTSGSDEDAFFSAGKYIVRLAEYLIVVWDGKPAKGRGGTGDIAAYAKTLGIPLTHINPINRTIQRQS